MKMHRYGAPSARTCVRTKARGIVSLEFVLVLPFVLMVLFGIIDTSLLLCDKAVITNAAGEAARQAVVLRAAPTLQQYGPANVQNAALADMQNTLVTGGTATTPTVTVTPATVCNPSVNASGAPVALTVQISYTYKGIMLGSALSSLTGPVTITATAVKNCE